MSLFFSFFFSLEKKLDVFASRQLNFNLFFGDPYDFNPIRKNVFRLDSQGFSPM